MNKTIEELKAAKTALEQQIFNNVSEFEKNFSCSVSRINLLHGKYLGVERQIVVNCSLEVNV